LHRLPGLAPQTEQMTVSEDLPINRSFEFHPSILGAQAIRPK